MQVLLGEEAQTLRELFVDGFVDTRKEYYVNKIAKLTQFSDGERYTGYLWDCLKNVERISYQQLLYSLELCRNSVYILWDLHSRDRILLPDYWKYPIGAVLQVQPGEISDILDTLPEDCYFFDASLSWALAQTHEETKPGKRLCYLVR